MELSGSIAVVGRKAHGRPSPLGDFMLISALVTFLVVILVLYLVNMLPVDGRVKQIIRIIVIIIGVISLLRILGVWI
jgi:hypothetical protein